jgi:PIN domain nuclease of toxin-antitoxin system
MVRVIALTPRVALRATSLPPLHNDPMDRVIVATSQLRRLTVITPDARIHAYPETS